MEKLLNKLPFAKQRWFQFLRFLTRHFIEDDCQQKAASLTYTTMLSIVPILTVLLMILSSVPALAQVRAQIYDVIYSNLLPSSSLQVSQYINSFAEKSSNLTIVGVGALFVTTIMTLTTIERAFNQIWRVEDKSGGMKSILRYWAIVTLGPLVLGTAFIVSSTVQSLSFLNKEIAGYGIDWAFWVQIISIAVTVAGFIAMYWFIPKARVPVKNAAIAGVVVAVIFELMRHLFGTIMTNFTSYEAIYGAFAALPIFLLWIYLSWNLILLGVEISYTLTIFETKEVYPRHPLLSLLDMLNLVYSYHVRGQSVSEQELRNVLGRKELPKWYTYINYLKDSKLITATEDDNYVLKRNLSNMTLWEFYKTLPYPLPIKDELDEMKGQHKEPWLSLLVQRFENTEKCARNQLDVPLAAIFAHSQPRKKATGYSDSAKKPHSDKLFDQEGNRQTTAEPHQTASVAKSYKFGDILQKSAVNDKSESETKDNSTTASKDNFDPAPFDKDSDKEYDHNDNEILIPDDVFSQDAAKEKDNLITEADNPNRKE
ncbi:YhjD/YihY/BrkB family envelope integrity protein [Psychrobacter ciconiae]|uniref:YhjD/YihY/BrkB family envelope integrity protein n=1 Tax=Psychrobacter ciconiae TaxID=1553449 RepID=UPI00191904F0|nr:YhjD/YihY/BrkB family envelope integrity protein [Psychrobacter ciconiae]